MSAVAATAPPVKVSTRSPRDQVLIVVMLVAVVAGAFYMLMWKPQSAALSAARDERAGAEAQLATATAAAVTAAEDDAAATDEAVTEALVVAAVPADVGTPEVLRQFDALAAQAGVRLGNITLSQPAALVADPAAAAGAPSTDAAAGSTISGPVSLGLTVDVSGDPLATTAFLGGIKSMPRLVVVDQVTVQNTPADEATGRPAIQELQLSVRVFATGG